MLSFPSFLHQFEHMIIDTLCQRNEANLQEGKEPLITTEELLKVVFRFYDRQLFEHSLAQAIESATGPSSVSFGFRVGQPNERLEAKDKLRKLLDTYKMKEYKESPLLDNFNSIVETVAEANYNGDHLRTALLIVYDVCIRKELGHYEDNINYSQSLGNCSNFRSGLEVQSFLFDVINHISGYTEKYYKELKEHMSHDDLVRKYRAEKEQYEGSDINQSPLLGDRFPHSLLVLESVQVLLDMPGANIKVGGHTKKEEPEYAMPVN